MKCSIYARGMFRTALTDTWLTKNKSTRHFSICGYSEDLVVQNVVVCAYEDMAFRFPEVAEPFPYDWV